MVSASRRALSWNLPSLCPLAVALVFGLAGCKGDEPKGGAPRGAPPPPVASSKPAACAGGGGNLSDAASVPIFPRTSGGFCLDPNGGDKAFGDSAPLPLDEICDL